MPIRDSTAPESGHSGWRPSSPVWARSGHFPLAAPHLRFGWYHNKTCTTDHTQPADGAIAL